MQCLAPCLARAASQSAAVDQPVLPDGRSCGFTCSTSVAVAAGQDQAPQASAGDRGAQGRELKWLCASTAALHAISRTDGSRAAAERNPVHPRMCRSGFKFKWMSPEIPNTFIPVTTVTTFSRRVIFQQLSINGPTRRTAVIGVSVDSRRLISPRV